jgi:hypothetical protein
MTKFFERYGEYVIPLRYYEGGCSEIDVEQLYQEFKERLIQEVAARMDRRDQIVQLIPLVATGSADEHGAQS